MNYYTFVNSMVMPLESETFEELKCVLINDYLTFSFVKHEDISKEILADKLNDYFEKVELHTGKSFEKHLDVYYSKLNSVVGSRVAKTPQPKKNDNTPVIVPRARKYYDKAIQIKGKEVTGRRLLDYTRLMMCLYAAIIKSNYTVIKNLDYSAGCINPIEILDSIKSDQGGLTLFGKTVVKKKFDIDDIYSSDTCTLVIGTVLLYKIVDDKVQGEYDYE